MDDPKSTVMQQQQTTVERRMKASGNNGSEWTNWTQTLMLRGRVDAQFLAERTPADESAMAERIPRAAALEDQRSLL